jgi:hypothetical protein
MPDWIKSGTTPKPFIWTKTADEIPSASPDICIQFPGAGLPNVDKKGNQPAVWGGSSAIDQTPK